MRTRRAPLGPDFGSAEGVFGARRPLFRPHRRQVHDELAPVRGPSLDALTEPPCIDVMLSTIASSSLVPPAGAVDGSRSLLEEIEDARHELERYAHPAVADADDHPGRPLRRS